jgi:hypothetical protein
MQSSIGKQVYDGGQGRICEVVGQSDRLAKIYLYPDEVKVDRLNESISWWLDLDASDRKFGEAHFAWPDRLISDSQGQRLGFEMKKAPVDTARQSPRGNEAVLYSDNLMCPPRPATPYIPQPSPDGRIKVCLDFANCIDWLHRHNIIFGDISNKNVLWAPSSERVFLVDCDQARFTGCEPPSPQGNTVGYIDARQGSSSVPGQSTMDADRYKVAIWIGRVLSRLLHVEPGQAGDEVDRGIRQSVSESSIPKLSAHRIFDLWQKAAVPGSTPLVEEWIMALSGIRGTLRLRPVTPPTTPAPRPPRVWRDLNS